MTTGPQLKNARVEAGLTLAALSELTSYTKGHLSNVENGARRVTRDVVLAYARAIEDSVNRRDLLLNGIVSLAAPGAVGELILKGFEAALSTNTPVDEWQQRVADYGRRYMTAGAAEVQRALQADLIAIQHQLDRPGLWSTAARLLAVYGKTTTDAMQAIEWYRAAVVAADRSGDDDTRVWVRGRAALALAYEGAALPVADQFARAAIEISGDRPSLGLLNATVARAHVEGARGELRAAMAADDQARRLFDRVGSDDGEVSDFAVPLWRLETFRSMLYARAGHARAEDAGRAADQYRPAELTRFRTHIELHRGLMIARSGDYHEGVRYARAAMDALPAERHSLTLRLVLDEVTRSKR